MNEIRMTVKEYKDLPKRTTDTVYEAGKYYKTMDDVLDMKGYIFRCEQCINLIPGMPPKDGIHLDLVKVIWTQ